MSITADGNPFSLLLGTFSRADFEVLRLSGTEALSRLFSFDLRVATSLDPVQLEASAVGQPATLTIDVPGGSPRVVHGIVVSASFEGAWNADHRVQLDLRIAPRFWLSKRRRNSRIFQNLTVVDIVNAVLDEAGVPRRWAALKRYPARQYCVQYEETDVDFVTRLLAEEGIFFYFEPPASLAQALPAGAVAGGAPLAEVLVLCDDPMNCPPIPDAHADGLAMAAAAAAAGVVRAPGPRLVVRDAGGMSIYEDTVTRFAMRRRVRAKTVTLRDYDPHRPLLDLTSSSSVASPVATAEAPPPLPLDPRKLEIYEHHGEYEETDVDGDQARVLLEQHRRRAWLGEGASYCRRLGAGGRFTLRHEASEHMSREYTVTRVTHTGVAPRLAQGAASGGALPATYENRFECVPASIPYRPRRPKRAVRQVLETATVVGPEGQDIHTDQLGRVKVQFHWDRHGRRDQHSSCWLRVAQAWAGAGWGQQFVPRVGTEVLVTFLGGDLDRPMVTGCVYNATHPPPFLLPNNATRSGLRTRSSPGGGGFNEISFEDRAAHEQIFVHAQRDLDEIVRRNHARTVGDSETLEVRGSQVERVGAHRTGHVGGDDRHTVGQNRELAVGGNSTVRVQGSETRRVEGALTTAVGGHAMTSVEQDYTLKVDGFSSTTLGADDGRGGGVLTARGAYTIAASGTLTLSSDRSLVLRCGDTTLELSAEGAKIGGKAIAMAGSESVTLSGNGPSIHLAEEGQILADKLTLLARESSIVLDDHAAVKGKTVRLNCDERIEPPEDPDDPANPKTKKLELKLTDYDLAPYAGKKFRLIVADRTIEGTTDGDGAVREDVPEGAETADLTLWTGDYPTGPRRRYAISLTKLADPHTVEGVQARLRNLGYYDGPTNGELTPGVVIALREFQGDHALEPTGILDAATRSKLMDVHGH
ncbi:type VI secretion system tip protein TssI/VgrG [Sorangium sp. So ce394]|uniref:type VI secretion system tip protein TssI/VgrG n=1 Tax=Sorangium sp. So ce394 TaxID=3133310 RepID=UPI003F5C7F67